MSLKWNLLRLVLCAGTVLTLESPIFAEADLQMNKTENLYATDSYYQHLIDQVHACVNYNQNIPYKNEIHQLFDQLQADQFVSQTGTDDFKAKFLLAQGCVEHVLCCSQILGEISNLIGVIHMPMPAAPLCTNLEESSLGEPLDNSIAVDQDKLLTIRSRPQMARDYLQNGGVLFVAYPKAGLLARTPEQQDNYLNAIAKYIGVLFDVPLDAKTMDPELVGATYAFKHDQQWYVFSMKARQAGTSLEDSEWALWFGKINQPIILKRVNDVCEFLIQNNGPNLKQFVLKGGK